MEIKQVIQDKLKKMWREAEERDAQRRAKKNSVSYINLSISPISVEALMIISENDAKKSKAVTISLKEKRVALAVYDSSLKETQELIKKLESEGYKLTIYITSLSGLNYAYGFYKFTVKETEKITGKVGVGETIKIESIKALSDFIQSADFSMANVGPVFETILSGALANRASDIHFEPEEEKVKLRLRIDGLLHDIFEDFPKNFYLALLSRIKLLSNLKINIRDEAQDGRFTIRLYEKDVEVRVAIAPSEFGEVAVMRLLDPAAISLSLSNLGLREDDLKIIETELKRPNGMILNTGPTGSGKTTTLYAFLRHKKNQEIKIITVEDPIEYHLEGIEQTQVKEESGYTFANGLRSLMRQDPDVILIGEMRDKETSEIGIQAALTGHLVFSTIHANSAAGSIPRLLDIGVKSTSIGPALNLAIAQRLVRRLCADCKKQEEISDDLKNKIEKFINNLPKRVNKENYKNIQIFKPTGCGKCNNSGYRGRVAIYELLLNDPEYEKILIGPASPAKRGEEALEKLSSHKDLEEMINSQAGESVIKKWAIENQGMVTMQQDGILKVISGMTTFKEVEEVVGILVW